MHVWKCPKCGTKIEVRLELKHPPTCSKHIGRKVVDMLPASVTPKEPPK